MSRRLVHFQQTCAPTCPTWSETTTLRTASLGKSLETTGPKFRGGFTLQGIGTTSPDRTTGGSGTLPYAIPENATLCRALLWWNTITNQGTNLTTITVNGDPLTGAEIGQAGNTNWEPGSINRVYRADVTDRITAISGTLALSGFPNIYDRDADLLDGSQGAALLLVYSSPTGRCSKLHIYDGCVAISNVGGTKLLSLPLDAPTSTRIGLAIGDSQDFPTDLFRLNGAAIPNSRPTARNGPMLDTATHNAPPNLTPPLTLTTSYVNDHLSLFLVVHAL